MIHPTYHAARFDHSWGVICSVACQGGEAGTLLEIQPSQHLAEHRAAQLNRHYRWWNNIDHPTWTEPEPEVRR
jgi:hypothetical protein